MEDSMDIDIDIGVDNNDYTQHDYAQPQLQEGNDLVTQTFKEASAAPDDIPEAYKDDFDAQLPAREKVYICGLDGVAQPVIQQFIEEYTESLKHRRLEWIDDSSLNIIYYNPDDARQALQLLSAAQDTLPASTELRMAKPFTARPDLQFSVRQALIGDKKKPGAKDRSAFYLFNPDWDPENRRGGRRDGRRNRDGRRDGDDRGRRRPQEKFTEDMYDDAPTAERAPMRPREAEDLFANGNRRDNGRLRDRSRSPARGEDGRYGFSDEQPQRRTARRRSWTPPGMREQAPSNAGRDLFDRIAPSNGNTGVELFPSHSSKRSRELFPHRTAHSNHRRSDALDNQETEEIFKPESRSLADRITGAPASAGIKGRGAVKADTGLSMKGASNGQSMGFSIKGASREVNPKVRELFPDRVGTPSNSGKELFPQRRRAEDMLD